MSIGQVLDQLAEEFPDLTHSKIRFLEGKGVIRPQRTGAGYRTYRQTDVDRLRQALRMQRDSYAPLDVIANHLDALEQGTTPPPVPSLTPVADIGAGPDVQLPVMRRARLRRAELVHAAQVAPAVVTELEGYKLISADKDGYFGVEDVDVVRTAAALAQVGLEARHLRTFRMAAEREAGLVEQIVAPMLARAARRGADSEESELREQEARTVATLCLRLHTGMYRAALTEADLP